MPYQIIDAGAYLNGQVRAGIITQEDADLIREFCEERKATKHIAEATALVTSKGLIKVCTIDCTLQTVYDSGHY